MTVEMYATRWCPDCRRAREFLDEHGVVFTEIDVAADPAASDEVLRRVGKRAVPQLVIDGEWFQPYTPGKGLLIEELHKRLGLQLK
jgi:mycoredoxin